jgi:ABC-type dipeptide/oligopeptide/nickel transport system permease component
MTTTTLPTAAPATPVEPARPSFGAKVMERVRDNRWWWGRLAVLPVHLLVFVVLTFILIRLMPSDPVRAMLGQNYTPEGYAALQEKLGLAGSLPAQLWHYLVNLVHFDLGNSLFTGRPVLSELSTRLPSTVELAFLGLIASVVISLVASYVAALHPRSLVGRIVRGYAAAAGAVPEYVLAVGGILLFYSTLHVVPPPLGRLTTGVPIPPAKTNFPLLDAALDGNFVAVSDEIAHLMLPVAVMAIAHSALLVKLLISGLDEAVEAGPTRFRIATGASRRAVLMSVYRRAAPSAITMCGVLFGYLLGGAVILETLFGFNGIGAYAVDAVNSGDFIALQGFLLVVATLSLLVFLAVDLVNMIVDPRRRPGVSTEAS